ncbi:MAG: hypothetical protein GX862_04545 [Leucobacter sp.]|nr:hypothetical protein [Leucobacter sp.]
MLALSREHRREVVELLPRASRHTFTLREFGRLAEVADLAELQPAADLSIDSRMREAVELVAQLRGSLPPLADPADDDVIDPYRQSPEMYEQSSQQIVPAVNSTVRLLRAASQLGGGVGGCPDPAGSLEVSFDDGQTWQTGEAHTVDARRLLQIVATQGDLVRLAAQKAQCATEQLRSFIGGTSWQLEPEPSPMWMLDPADATLVHTPIGAHTLPCQAVQLASDGAQGAVLCSDGAVVTSVDGETWSEPVAVPHGVAIGFTSEGVAVASVGEPECAGVRTRLLAGGAIGAPGACVDVAGAGDGNTALTGDAGEWYLWAGESFLRSADAGQTWG